LLRGQSRFNFHPAFAGDLPRQGLSIVLILDTCPCFSGIKKSEQKIYLCDLCELERSGRDNQMGALPGEDGRLKKIFVDKTKINI